MLKEKTLVEILWEVWEKQPDAFNFLSPDDKQELVTEASILDKDIKKSLSFKQKVWLSNTILNLYLKGRNSRKEQVEISAPVDLSKPLQKYVEINVLELEQFSTSSQKFVPCLNKFSYDSESADAKLKEIAKDTRPIKKPCRKYLCEKCGLYHLTSKER